MFAEAAAEENDGATGPLAGLRVVDLGVGMAAALAVKLLADAGADMVRIEPPAGDPFYEIYPAYRFWHRQAKIMPWSREALVSLLGDADLCVIGGEDYPGLDWSFDPGEFRLGHDRLVILEFRGQPPGTRATPAVDILMQARSGLTFEHFTDRPMLMALPAPTYGSALSGVAAALAAIVAQRKEGKGRLVTTSLLQGAVQWLASLWLDLNGEPATFEAPLPKDCRELLFRCKDGLVIQISMSFPGALLRIHRALGVESDASEEDRGVAPGVGDYHGVCDRLEALFAEAVGADLLPRLQAEGVVADRVAQPGECWDDPQTGLNGVVVRHIDATRGVGLPFVIRQAPVKAQPTRRVESGAHLPLHDVRVVDCGHFIAGPYVSVMLGDLGARVVKIEPLTGDPLRMLIRQLAAASRGKRSLSIDAKVPEGREIVRRICVDADIVHYNFRPGIAPRLGLDHASLSAVNPDIIVLDSSAYGSRGPDSARPGFDRALQALSGLEYLAGGAGNPPIAYRMPIVDYTGALLGSIGVLAALVAQAGGRGGATVETSLLNASVFLLAELVQEADGTFVGARELNGAQTGFHPAEQLYRVADGWIAVAARDENMAGRLLRTLDIHDSTPRRDWGESQARAIAGALSGRQAVEVLALFERAGVWSERCTEDGWASLKADPLLAAEMIVEGPLVSMGIARQIGRTFGLCGADAPDEQRGFVDACGHSSREILCEHGYSDARIDQLLGDGVVQETMKQRMTGSL